MPDLLTIGQLQCKKPAAAFGQRLEARIKLEIGQGNVDIPLVHRWSPFDSSDYASLSDADLPQRFAFSIRVQCMDDT